jgi:hypothetical protein
VPGTSLVCIQGDWSNIVDGKIKGALASLALGGAADSPYNPLYARAAHVPRPWGVTTLFGEYTGNHPPIEIDWSAAEKRTPFRLTLQSESDRDGVAVSPNRVVPVQVPVIPAATNAKRPRQGPAFGTFWDFALAVNRSDSTALKLAANVVDLEIPIDVGELRRLLSTFWFRSVFPRLSAAWQQRVLDVLAEQVAIPNHAIRTGRRTVHLSELSHEQRRRLLNGTALPDAVRADLQLLVMVATLWGEEAVKRFGLPPAPDAGETSALAALLQPFRHS